MVDFNKIDLGKINAISNVQSTSSANIGKVETKRVFGDGFASTNVGFERKVVPEFLLNKFSNIEIPKYDKNIAQLVINDKDYIPDKTFEENALCEV